MKKVKKTTKVPRKSSLEKTQEKSGQSKVKVNPCGDRVLIRPFTEEALRHAQGQSQSYGIILPDTVTKEKSAQGKILAVGEGKLVDGKLIPIRVKVGETVLFSKYGYDEVEQDGEELYLLKEDSILAVIK